MYVCIYMYINIYIYIYIHVYGLTTLSYRVNPKRVNPFTVDERCGGASCAKAARQLGARSEVRHIYIDIDIDMYR